MICVIISLSILLFGELKYFILYWKNRLGFVFVLNVWLVFESNSPITTMKFISIYLPRFAIQLISCECPLILSQEFIIM